METCYALCRAYGRHRLAEHYFHAWVDPGDDDVLIQGMLQGACKAPVIGLVPGSVELTVDGHQGLSLLILLKVPSLH